MTLEFIIKKNYKEAYAGMREVIAALALVADTESRLLNAKYCNDALTFQVYFNGEIEDIENDMNIKNAIKNAVDEEAAVLA